MTLAALSGALSRALNWLKDKAVAFVDWVEAHPWIASFIIVGQAALNGWLLVF